MLHRNKFWVESAYPDILRKLLKARSLMIDSLRARSCSPLQTSLMASAYGRSQAACVT